jgi:PAS domain S-box-containing protein
MERKFLMIEKKSYSPILIGILVLFGLYMTSLYSYLLFHSLAEIFSIVVACGIFMIAWNSRRFLDNTYLLFIGIAYLFVGGLDLIHTLAYKGMGVFEGYGTNLPTQLWIAARYVESFSLLIAPLLLGRKLKVNVVFLGYTLATTLLLGSIFYLILFPICFVEGVGLTPFKKISEYVISLVLFASVALLFRKRYEFDASVLRLLVASIILTIVSELAFTFYVHAYGLSNLIGHYLKIISFYFIYKAIIETGLAKPYALLFKDLKQSEEALRKERDFTSAVLSTAGALVVVLDREGRIVRFNQACEELTGYSFDEVRGKSPWELFLIPDEVDQVKAHFAELRSGQSTKEHENYWVAKDGSRHLIMCSSRALLDHEGLVEYVIGTGIDITERKRAEEALRESEENLKAILDSSTSAVLLVDTAGSILALNETITRSLGKHADELLGSCIYDALPADVAGGRRARAEEVIRKGKPLRFEDERQGRWFGNSVYPVFDAEGKVTRLAIYARDITERKQADEAVQRSKEFIETVMNSITDSICIIDTQDFKVIATNRAFLKTVKNEEKEIIGKTCYELTHGPSEPCGPPEHICPLAETVKTGRPSLAEHVHLDSDGNRIYVETSTHPIKNAKGEVYQVVHVTRDISERKRTEEELRKLSRAMEQSPVSVVITDAEGIIDYVNPKFVQLTGYTAAEAIGQNPRILKSGKQPPEFYRELWETITRGEEWRGEFHNRKRNGDFYWEFASISPIKNDEGAITHFIGVKEDISERKRAEEELRAEKAFSESMLNAMVDTVFVFNPDTGKPLRWNKAFNEISGYTDEEITFIQAPDGWYDEADLKRVEAATKRVFGEGQATVEMSLITKNGKLIPTEYTASLVKNTEGKPEYILAIGRDITERKRAEEALQKAHDQLEQRVDERTAELKQEIQERERTQAALQESEKQLRYLSSQLMTAQENERKSVAQELHDSIGQTLAAIKFGAEKTLEELGKRASKKIRQPLEAVISMVQNGIQEVRRIQMNLRPSTLDDLGIIATISWFCREFQTIYAQIRIEKEIDIQEDEVPDPLKTIMYRVLQEALHNVAKHSQADHVRLSLRKTDSTLELAIEDNGLGFDLEDVLSVESSKMGLGLASMRERTELSGGSFAVESSKGKGTIIRAVWKQ